MQQRYNVFQVIILTLIILALNYCLLWSFHHFAIKPYPNNEIYILGLTYLIIILVTGLNINNNSINVIHKTVGFHTVQLQAVFVAIILSIGIWLSDYLYQTFILESDLAKEATKWFINNPNQTITFMTMVIFAPIIEEVLLRGVLLQSLQRHMNTILATLTVSLLFTLLHDSYEQWATLFIASTIYCWLTLRYKSILPSIIAHILNNAFTFVYYRQIETFS